MIGGRFTVEARVAAGGMGVVHRARDGATGKLVALKLLTQLDPDSQERFAREAAILAELDHPAIVRYVAHGRTDEGKPFIAMEWVEGETLFARLAMTGVSTAETVLLGRRLGEAFGYAHARGVIHRDIKPSNILLRGGAIADVAILDFGIARAATTSGSLTETGAMLGTPSYMSPEQARGERTIDARADVFALGSVLYECATGRMAFEARHVLALVAKVVLWDPPRLHALVPDAPVALDELLARMLAKDPARRPSNGAELAAELGRISIAELDRRPRPAVPAHRRPIAPTPAVPERLVSVVAATSSEACELGPDILDARRSALAAAFAPFDVHFELLHDGSIVAIAAGAIPAAVVQRAIACAREIRVAAPDLLVAVKSGPLDGDDAVAAAARGLLEATVAALAKEAMAAIFAGINTPARPKRAISLDETTARYCPPDTIVRAGGICYLAGA